MGRWATSLIVLGAAACAATEESPRVHVATSLLFPRGVLDGVTKIHVKVYEGADCDSASGVTTAGASATTIAETDLAKDGCAAGALFCGDVQVDESETMRVFAASATDDGGSALASGCTAQAVDQDAVDLSIIMVGNAAPAVCGDNVVQVTEQCDPPDGKSCDAQCHTTEILLSTGAAGNGTQTGAKGDKADPWIVWPAGDKDAGRLFAFYTDADTGGNATDVGIRVMSSELAPVDSPAELAAGSIFMPHDASGVFPPAADPRAQEKPCAAIIGNETYVVFQDDTGTPATGQDIHLIAFDANFNVSAAASGVNGTGGEAGAQAAPAIAASGTALLIAWEDVTNAQIWARPLTVSGTLGTQVALSGIMGNTHVSLAGTTDGWAAAWQSGSDVVFRAVTSLGTPAGSATTISNAKSSPAILPRVASLADGRFAVTWMSSGKGIFVQRFTASGGLVAGDAATPINNPSKSTNPSSPAITGTTGANGSYVVVWSDSGTGHVYGRALGGDGGFLGNPVDGTTNQFQASVADKHARATPTVAAGGSAPFLAIGWADQTDQGTSDGILARRFPLPL